VSNPLDLTTLDNVKNYLGLTVPPLLAPTPAYTDALLSRMITACSTYAATYCSRVFQLTTYSEVRNGLGGTYMTLKQQPVTAVASLTINGLAIPARPPLGGQSATGYGYGYTFDRTRIMVSGPCFYQGMQNVAITYTAGFATTPADLEQAIIDWVGDEFKYKDRIGKASEGIEGQTIAFNMKSIPPRVQSVLNIYNTVAPVY
jgi:hypothetical protein